MLMMQKIPDMVLKSKESTLRMLRMFANDAGQMTPS
jgi:hypothetical protein